MACLTCDGDMPSLNLSIIRRMYICCIRPTSGVSGPYTPVPKVRRIIDAKVSEACATRSASRCLKYM